MTAVHRLLTVLAFAAVLAAPLSAAAATSCCVCTRAAGSNACRESRSHDGATAAVAASRTACDRVTRDLGGAYTCSFVADSGTGCTTQPNCAAGVGTVAPLNEEAPAAPAAPAGSPSSGGTTNVNVPFTPAVPTLALPIPSFAGFSTLQVQTEGENRYIDVPFVAEYILALYRFSIGVIVTLAMVMIVIGGLRWVTAAGNASTIGSAKDMIVRSVTGLLVALGSYTVLYLISPDLVEFRSIRVNLVTRVDVEQELLTTTENTMDLDSAPGASGAGGGSGGGGGGGGGYRRCDEGEPRSTSGCPVSLSAAVSCSSPSEPRTREFLAAIRGACPGGEAGVVCAAEAAARCGVHMGSCLATARALARSTGATIRQRPGRSVNSNLLVPAQAAGNECRAAGGSEADCRRRAKDTAAAAIAAAYPGWPDSWIDELEPGDTFMVYNGRPGGRGQHSAIFVSRSGGYANVVQSAAAHYVSTGRICISRSCGGVLTRTYITE